MHSLIPRQYHIVLIFFHLLVISVLAQDPPKPPYDVLTEEQLKNSHFLDTPTELPTDGSQIRLQIDDKYFCLTDPDTRLQPRSENIFEVHATLEECAGEYNPHQHWRSADGTGLARLYTQTMEPNNINPALYTINNTRVEYGGIENVATGRCIHGAGGYNGTTLKLRESLSSLDYWEHFGFVYLARVCGDNQPRFKVRAAVVGSSPENTATHPANGAYAEVKEVVYFEYPSLENSGRSGQCPNSPRPLEEVYPPYSPWPQYYFTKTMIVPVLIPATINNIPFYPASFGCASNTDHALASFNPPAVLSSVQTYNEEVEKRLQCVRDREEEAKNWPNTDEYKALKKKNDDLNYCRGAGKFVKWLKVCQEFRDGEWGLKDDLPSLDRQPDFGLCDIIRW
ncbi:hypothetical protein TWF481_003975 [Arthrobotrys musiformis]|uniref:Uncharacterized protein n=1 Tax=Arthrobotrys musiformis TaxID=47236 RepID=A0AAV9WK29_9PEZI